MTSPMIQVAGLAGALASARPPRVLDVRWRLAGPPTRPDHAAGHIPGAVFIDLDADVCGPPGALGRHPLPDPGRLGDALRAAGVRGDQPVVVYDGGDGLAAARLWWTLRWAGHPDVRVLDGGYPAWLAAGGPVEAGEHRPPAGDFVPVPGGLPVLDAAAAARLAAGATSRGSTSRGSTGRAPAGATDQGSPGRDPGDRDAAGGVPGGVLLDVRAPQRYRGETEPIDPVAGHIPGAVNLPITELFAGDGTLASATDLRARFAEAGVVEGTPVGAYCGSGVTAAVAVLALTTAGYADAALYVGSWSEWIADPARPVATS